MADREMLARRLARRITSFADPSVRVAYLTRFVERLTPAQLADLFTFAVHGAEARQPDQGELLLSLCLALAREEHDGLRAAVVREAVQLGHRDTAALLSPQPPTKSVEEPMNVPDFGRGRPVSLGERKSLARRRDRDLLARVIRDPAPEVIRILLGNPALTEDDVLRLCAARPVAPEVLREVFLSTRWIVRYRVRRAIVRNPFTPLNVALQLAAHLTSPDARAVVDSQELAVPLRDACRRIARLETLH